MVDGVRYNPFTNQVLTPEQIQKLDTNNDGVVSAEELEAGMAWLSTVDEEGVVDFSEPETQEPPETPKTPTTSPNAQYRQELEEYLRNDILERYDYLPKEEFQKIKTRYTNAIAEFLKTYDGTGDIKKEFKKFLDNIDSELSNVKFVIHSDYSSGQNTQFFSKSLMDEIERSGNNISDMDAERIKQEAEKYLISSLFSGGSLEFQDNPKYKEALSLIQNLETSSTPRKDYERAIELIKELVKEMDGQEIADRMTNPEITVDDIVVYKEDTNTIDPSQITIYESQQEEIDEACNKYGLKFDNGLYINRDQIPWKTYIWNYEKHDMEEIDSPFKYSDTGTGYLDWYTEQYMQDDIKEKWYASRYGYMPTNIDGLYQKGDRYYTYKNGVFELADVQPIYNKTNIEGVYERCGKFYIQRNGEYTEIKVNITNPQNQDNPQNPITEGLDLSGNVSYYFNPEKGMSMKSIDDGKFKATLRLVYQRLSDQYKAELGDDFDSDKFKKWFNQACNNVAMENHNQNNLEGSGWEITSIETFVNNVISEMEKIIAEEKIKDLENEN